MSGPSTTNNGQIQKRAEKPGDGLAKLLDSMKGQMALALPKHLTADRMARITMTAIRTVKGLHECTPASFAACVMTLSQIGLEPCTPLGHAYLIPRKNRRAGTVECTLIIGYQGMIELARRSGEIASIWATPVFDGDRFVVRYGLAPTIEHEPKLDGRRDRDALTHVYAVARLKNSTDPVFVVLTRKEVDALRNRGASGQGISTPWDTDFPTMAMKTAIRQLWRWLPKSIEIASALAADEHSAPTLSVVSDAVADAVAGQGLELPADTEAEVLDVAEVPDAVPAGEVKS